MSGGLEQLNSLDPDGARIELMRCCRSESWARQMEARRPFATTDDLLDAADEIWASLGKEDWLEAFSHHPRIGGSDADRDELKATREWSRSEQSGMAGAPQDVKAELAAGNDAYYDRFGYVFLICAAGKSAEHMLEQLTERLDNNPEREIFVAAEEQRRITRLRLDKLAQRLDKLVQP